MKIKTALKSGLKTVNMNICGTPLQAEIASTPEEKRSGLMFRQELPPNQGMLFTYNKPQQVSFWMANTAIPLDVGFFTADGKLQEVRSMKPFDLTSVVSKQNNIQYALEVNRGWFEHHCGHLGN
jgi:hypothetical protein